MKLKFWDRVLATLYVLLSLALCVFVALRSLGLDIIGGFYEHLTLATSYWYIIYFGCLLIVVLLGVYVLRLLFARRPRKSSFVTVDAGENGKVIISMDALEQMVRQAVTKDEGEGIADMKIDVAGHEDSISVLVELAVHGGVHLPTITMNLQRDIRRYVEVNCGVAVRDVTVKVGSVLAPEGQAEDKQERQGKEFGWIKGKAAPERAKPAPIPAAAADPEPAAEPELEAVVEADASNAEPENEAVFDPDPLPVDEGVGTLEEVETPEDEPEAAEPEQVKDEPEAEEPEKEEPEAFEEPRERKWGSLWEKPWKSDSSEEAEPEEEAVGEAVEAEDAAAEDAIAEVDEAPEDDDYSD